MQQLSFRFVLDMSGGNGELEAVAAIFALHLQHQSQIGNLYINYYITREYWILPSCRKLRYVHVSAYHRWWQHVIFQCPGHAGGSQGSSAK
ncbi:hypothetical protein WJX77_011310 [Trebouxia sp. C0004]